MRAKGFEALKGMKARLSEESAIRGFQKKAPSVKKKPRSDWSAAKRLKTIVRFLPLK